MTKEEKKKQKRYKEQQQMISDRTQRLDNNLVAIELYDIRKNMPLHKILHKLISINNGLLEKMEKDYQGGIEEILKEYKDRPVIFAPNHVRMQDIEVQMEATPIHQVLLSGDYENVHGSVAGMLLEKNGIIYFDMENSIDRKNVVSVLKDVLEMGYNVLWYYEGTWCVSPNKPYNDGSYQIVQTAIDTNAIVMPVIFDMIGHKKAVIRYGTPIDYIKIYGDKKLSHEEKIEGLDILKGQIGKGIIDVWEQYCYTHRDDLVQKYVPNLYNYPTPEEAFSFKKPEKYGPLHKYWDEYLEKILSEWEFTLEDLERKRFKDKTNVAQEEAFNHLYEIEPNMNNAFLFSKRNHH